MKKLLYPLLVLICMTACEKVDVGDVADDGKMSNIQFSAFTPSLIEDGTRASLIDAKCSKFDFAMFDADGNLYQKIQQENTDEDFGTIELSDVPYGTYSVVLIASISSVHAVVQNPALASFSSVVPDTFCKYMTLVVNKSTEAQQSVELNRISSQFSLVSSDMVPAGMDTLQCLITGGSTLFNPMTGLAPNADLNVREINVDIAHRVGKSLNVAFYTFLPSEEANISVVLNAKDASGAVKYSQTIPSAPMKVNCKTQYSGKFFLEPSASTKATITVDNSWADTFAYTF